MSILSALRHFIVPHAGNNFRSRLLHNSSLLVVLGLFLALNLFSRFLDSTPAHILGFTSNVTIDEVVRATNDQRLTAGLPPLAYNEQLADAARRKAANMLSENYWSHTGPSGKSPWYWFTEAGYRYTYAGENLAKDFASTSRLMEAWMASSTHRDNIVSTKYQEIGVAVVPGTLTGSETVLVVQLFGSTAPGRVADGESASAAPSPIPSPLATPAPTIIPTIALVNSSPVPAVKSATPETVAALVAEVGRPRVDVFALRQALGLFTTGLFILVLVADLVLAESRSLSRRVGKNWAHILFINFILLAVTVVNAGHIL